MNITPQIYKYMYIYIYIHDFQRVSYIRQDIFWENYFTNQRDHIFLNVELLIYVFDVEREGEDFEKDLVKYEECIEAIQENSPSTKVQFTVISTLINLTNSFQRYLF